MDLAVVICAHDTSRWPRLRDAVGSVLRQTLPAREVIVVIDHNAALEQMADAELEGVRVVGNVEAPGLGGGRNTGLRFTDASVVAFLDDDAVADGRWLETLAVEYEDPAVAGVGGSIQPSWESQRPSWFPDEFAWVIGCTHSGMPSARAEVRNLIGCNMSFRRDVLEAIDRFRLGYGCDETDLCIRIHQRWPDKKLIYVPDASVLHSVPPDKAALGRFLSRCFFEGGSKAVLSWLVGSADGLSSERRYTARTLPAAFVRELRAFGLARDPAHLARASVLVAGLSATTVGYLAARVRPAPAACARGWTEDTRSAA